ncbi:MAG: zinc ABC transporter substrate-binding protein [Desulfatiglandales bacterium]|nr:zinc ABC transporter substrate-binding protein [Desulfatiglandales bacterium]
MKFFAITVELVFCFLGMSAVPEVEAAEPVPVMVSIVPQKYFVEKIGGELVKVSVMAQPGASPATYEPKPGQMVALSRAKIYFAIGVPFEKAWLKKIAAANPKMLIVHTEKGIKKRRMRVHTHEAGGKKGDEGRYDGIKDPHVWLSPPQVMTHARNILEALRGVDPVCASIYEANYKKFITELRELDAEIRGIFAQKGGDIEFMVFHPAWGYFADTYGLVQIPIEIEGKDPKPAKVHQIIGQAKKRGVKVIFVQPQFSTKSAGIIAKAIGGKVVFANPLSLDWAKNIRHQAANFKAALR